MYVFAGFFDTQWLRNTYVSYLMWFAPLSEPATTFFLLTALYCYLLSLEDKRFVWFAAIAAGFGMCIRVPSAIYCIVFAAGYVLSRRSRDALVFAAVAGVMFIPQLIYNSEYYDGMFSSGYSPEAARRGALYSFAYTEQFFSYLTH
jgi:hypothetical protein